MEEPVAEHLIEKGAGGLSQQLVDPVPGGRQRRTVVNADTRNPLQGQHAAAGALPIDSRNAKVRVAGKIPCKFRGRRCLEAQVHLEPHHLGQGLHHFDRL